MAPIPYHPLDRPRPLVLGARPRHHRDPTLLLASFHIQRTQHPHRRAQLLRGLPAVSRTHHRGRRAMGARQQPPSARVRSEMENGLHVASPHDADGVCGDLVHGRVAGVCVHAAV